MSPLRITLGFLALVVIRITAWLAFELPLIFLSTSMILGIAALAGTVVITWATFHRRTTVRRWAVIMLLIAGFFTSLAPLRNTPISRFKTAYQAIHVGMSYAEVMEIINRQFPGTKPHLFLDPVGGGYVNLGAVDPGFNSEAFGVHIEDGRVISKEYLPD